MPDTSGRTHSPDCPRKEWPADSCPCRYKRVKGRTHSPPDLSITDHPFRPRLLGTFATDACDTCGEHSIWHKPAETTPARGSS